MFDKCIVTHNHPRLGAHIQGGSTEMVRVVQTSPDEVHLQIRMQSRFLTVPLLEGELLEVADALMDAAKSLHRQHRKHMKEPA